jgi:hypothetical protein
MTKKNVPYYNTQISPEQTKANIEKLLREHGIRDTQWTTYHGQTSLKFIWKVTVKGVEKEIAFGFTPSIILIPRRQYSSRLNKYEKVQIPHEAMSYRLLWWYLKVKLEAVEYGLESVEKEFMSHILVALPNGRETTIGENLQNAILENRLQRFALPDKDAVNHP